MVYDCRCVAGYVCQYSKQLRVLLVLNMPASQFNATAQATLKAQVAAASGVGVESVTIVNFYTPDAGSFGGGRRLLVLKSKRLHVRLRVEGAESLRHETVRAFRPHAGASGGVVAHVEWETEDVVNVMKSAPV